MQADEEEKTAADSLIGSLARSGVVEPILEEQAQTRILLQEISGKLSKSRAASAEVFAEVAPQLKRASLVARELLQDLEEIGVRIKSLKNVLGKKLKEAGRANPS
uniref:KxDL domain-containing protein n=1 Tax=Rhodosorus marinus TaxID=101924 RepID=A0A7S0BJR7_9RHOD|mmetsp:Transcript_19090/g.27664  ORF Transcript_19090/g.27664 Transcript_19090/m.27664 type:complete len:105 (+) Transcript_19090:496-810(+)